MQKKQGFTLIELIVVLVIMGIVAGVAVPRYTGSFDSLNFRRTMSGLVFFLREARIQAMTNNKVTRVSFALHEGFCWNEDKKIVRLPQGIEMFTDKFEAREDQIKIFTFYPNGTALDEKLGFVCDRMVAVLHVEPLGGLAHLKINEEMEQVVRYARSEEAASDEEIENEIDKLMDSGTLTKDETTGEEEVNADLDEDEELDAATGSFDEDDEDDEDYEDDEGDDDDDDEDDEGDDEDE